MFLCLIKKFLPDILMGDDTMFNYLRVSNASKYSISYWFLLNFRSLMEFLLLYMRLDQEVHQRLKTQKSNSSIPIPIPVL